MSTEIDENLYSRQLYVLGHEAMKRMAQSNVLIVGLSGIGVEIAKNVILTGVKSVTLHDEQLATWNDLSAQFYLTENNIGQSRLTASIAHLKELNPYVPVKEHFGPLTEEVLSTFNVAVFADSHISSLCDMNDLCRKHGVKFIAVESRGVFGSLFCDFGTGFEVFDTDGENTVSNLVTNISNDNPAVVSVHEEKRTHGLYDGDVVVFEDVQGMEELNKLPPMEIKSTGKHTFTISCDTTKMGKYTGGGYAKQVKKKKVIDFLPLRESLKNPTMLETDFAKLTRPAELHTAFRALTDFSVKFKRLPLPYNKDDSDQLVQLAKHYSDNINEDIVRKLSFTSQGNLNPMAAFLGGLAGQEVQKACSGKFHPIFQWLYFDAVEALPETLPSEEDAKPIQSRYDGQIAVFGKAFQKSLLEKKVFVVGAGALGCEYLKNYALMGVGCSQNGKVFVTDMDSIEVSNLNRQFLFRQKHVGKMKSTTAAEVATQMNPALNVVPFNDRVAPNTEHVFDDEFWESLDCVTNALDNVQARIYVDSRCVYYKKPLMEAGTLGTKGNVQIVVPHLTESYASSPDPPEQEIPICTLKNFPNAIEHTIQWARDLFEGSFKSSPEDVNAYLSKPEFLKEIESQGAGRRSTLEGVLENLVTSKPLSFEDCIAWARFKFESLFNNQIAQLLYNFPLDMITTSGTPFWGGPKRPPVPLVFDAKDPTHLSFVISAANLRAEIYGLKGYGKDYDFAKVLSSINVPKFVPQTGVKISTTEAEAKNNETVSDDDEAIQQIVSKLPKPTNLVGYRLTPIQFEKDDDTNFHIDFITATSNLRARNYKIKESDRHQTKGIAGKIIPAMVTTTALITGLASFEFYKIVLNKKKIEDYKNSFVNIAIPFVTLSEPMKPAQQKMQDTTFTLWDRLEINVGKDVTMKEFLEYFKDKYKLEISMMSSGAAVLYSFFGNKKKIQERMGMKLSEVVKEVSKQDFLPKQKFINLEVCCNDDDGNDVEVPFVKYRFRT